MKVVIVPKNTASEENLEDACIVECLFEESKAFGKFMRPGVFIGKAGEIYALPTIEKWHLAMLLVGFGNPEDLTAEKVRRAAGKAAAVLKQHRVGEIHLQMPEEAILQVPAFLEGLMLGQYDFDVYKSRKESDPQPVNVESVTVVAPEGADVAGLEAACRRAVVTCVAVNGARHLANTPPNEMTPAALAEFACGIAAGSEELKNPHPSPLPGGEGTRAGEGTGSGEETESAEGSRHGKAGLSLGTGKCCECIVLEQMQMASLGMNALLGVSLGSAQAPKLIILTYHHSAEAKTVAMVGKGVTFDSGGISIKPAQSMHEMKYDMCGAAAVLCAMMALVELKPAVNVVCVVPATENMTGDAAQRPGDIVRAYNGVTIEVLNTDAEGRMILADAMAYTVDKYKPDVMVDLATLTGACVVALGGYRAGLFTEDDVLAEDLMRAADASGDLLWRLPMGEDYEKLIESPHADIANIGPKGEAGATMGAVFLKKFVGETPWAHLDIAGTAWGATNLPHLDPKHASGYGVRLLVDWVMGESR